MVYLGQQPGPAYGAGAPVGGGPNFLGGGMYQGGQIPINQGAFNNPLGAQAAGLGATELGNYLGNTSGAVTTLPNAQYNQAVSGLGALGSQYATMAAGGGPSLATVTAQQQGAANLANTESMLGSARGSGNPAAAQLAASNANTQGQQQVAANAVAGRTQEELGALSGENNVYGALGGLGLQQQGYGLQAGLANQQNTLASNTNYLNALTGINNQQQQGQISGQQLAAQTALGQQNIENNAYNASAGQNSKIFGSLMSGAGSIAGALM